jgi:hypothetical protein
MIPFNLIKFSLRAACRAFVALAAGALLSGCASTAQQNAGGCVGPPSFCNTYFGS